MSEALKGNPSTSYGLCIIGPYGNVWSDDLFKTPEDAELYLDKFWGVNGWDHNKFKFAEGVKTISSDDPSPQTFAAYNEEIAALTPPKEAKADE